MDTNKTVAAVCEEDHVILCRMTGWMFRRNNNKLNLFRELKSGLWTPQLISKKYVFILKMLLSPRALISATL